MWRFGNCTRLLQGITNPSDKLSVKWRTFSILPLQTLVSLLKIQVVVNFGNVAINGKFNLKMKSASSTEENSQQRSRPTSRHVVGVIYHRSSTKVFQASRNTKKYFNLTLNPALFSANINQLIFLTGIESLRNVKNTIPITLTVA